MQFSTQKDIQAPIKAAFAVLSDFHAIEAAAAGRKVDVKRLDTLTEIGVGMSWDIAFRMRGKRREMIIDLVEFSPPEVLEFSGISSAFEVTATVALTAVTPEKTRMKVTLAIVPRSLGARLMIQSAKLGKSSLNKKYDQRIDGLAKTITERATIG